MIKQGEIYWVNLNPTKGSEQSGMRPVLVISGNTMNEFFNISIVCPLTTKVKNYKGCPVLIKSEENGIEADSEVLSFQVRSVSQERFGERIGKAKKEELKQVIEGLGKVLKY